MQNLVTDVVVIGAGTAGMTAYKSALRAGKKAILIEGGPYGTTCARVGCMPSKLLIAAADAAHNASHSGPFGVHIDGKLRIDGKQVMQRVKTERDRFVSFVINDINEFAAETMVRGYARFIDANTVQVDEHTRIQANSFVVATGSTPVIPPELLGAEDRVIVNDDVFEWEDLPKRIVVVGSGVIALELAQALARLGVETTVLARSNSLGGISDPVVREAARHAFEQELTLKAHAKVKTTEVKNNQVVVTYEHNKEEHQLQADFVLSAAGRRPNVAALQLEKAGASFDEKGMPTFDPHTLLIKNTSIFFAGDVNNQHPILHEAADDGFQSGLNAANWPQAPQAVARRASMGVVFTDPQLMRVGKTYSALKVNEVLIGEVSFKNQGRSRVMLKNQGVLRVYAHKESGRFLGAEMAGPAAEHLAHLLAWSLQAELTISQMLAMPFYHPVIEEGLRTALRQAQSK